MQRKGQNVCERYTEREKGREMIMMMMMMMLNRRQSGGIIQAEGEEVGEEEAGVILKWKGE